MDENGNVRKVSVDVEKAAADSHYDFAPDQAQKLLNALEESGYRGNLAEKVRAFLRENGEAGLVRLMRTAGVQYQEFHYD